MQIWVQVWRLFRYHFGSIVFGAFIVAVIQFLRAIVEYIDYKTRDKDGEQPAFVKFLLCCVKCCQ